jgi:uncharacterized phage infection (PIP) family protein YhgE
MTEVRRTWSGWAVLLVGAMLLAACGSDGSSSSSASTCTALQGVASSVRDLKNVDLVAEGASGLDQALEKVQAAWDTAKQDASDQFGADLDALESAVKDFRSTLKDGRGDASMGDWVQQLGDGVGAIGDAYQQLSDDVSKELSDCDLSQ